MLDVEGRDINKLDGAGCRAGILITWMVLVAEGRDIHTLDSAGCGGPGY
jgi:hypothetical protein